jgi:glyceraldehyde-3-phosphate dehydrogenase/erythrose-4-phosphate dehydrogenase
MSKIKFGVIGMGHIGKRHASMVMLNDECELVAICDVLDKNHLGLMKLMLLFTVQLKKCLRKNHP